METNHRGIDPTSYASGFQNPRGFAKLKRFAAAALAALAASSLHAELVPAARLTNWTPGVTVGVPGGIPNRTKIVDVTAAPYYADKTGASNAGPAIQAAINASVANDVIYLPAGTYRVDSPLVLDFNKDNRTLRGAGPGQTIIDSRSASGYAIYVGTSSDYQWAYPSSGNVITAGVNKGSTQITIANTSAFNVGSIAHLSFANDNSLPVLHVSSTKNAREQNVRITGKTATTLTFTPALHTNYYAANAKVFAAQLQADGVGIEDLTLDCTNGQPVFGIQFEQCYGSWVKNVTVTRAKSYSIFVNSSLNCEVRHSYFNEIKTSGTNGAGFLMQGSSNCLIEDNIIYKAFPLMEINYGCTGNVIAYNFLENSTVSGVVGAGIDTNHGPHNSFNLYEGNLSPNIQADGYFGSVSEDTILRNWFHGTSPGAAKSREAVMLQRFTRNYSVVGNMLGKPGMTFYSIDGGVAPRGPYSFGLPNMGNTFSDGTAQLSAGDPWASLATLLGGTAVGPGGFQERDLDVEATLVLKANVNLTNGTVPANESLGGDTLPNSLYLAGKPGWFGNLTWPAFGPGSATPSYASIPAGYRYLYGVDPDGQSTTPPPPPPTTTAPAITQQPQAQSVTTGATVTFTAAASGNPAPSYQWRKDGVNLSGATGASLTLTNVQSANAGGYSVVATNSAGSATSNTASLTVTAGLVAPVFTAQPANVTVTAGGTATFSAAASGNPAASYQWRKNGANISGATSATLTIGNAQSGNAGTYSVVASNSMGSATSANATLTVNASVGLSAPAFTLQPTSRTAAPGTATTFTVATTGNPAPSYQWRKNGADIAGATGASYTIGSVTTAHAGTYTVRALNSMGLVMSDNAVLTVSQPATAPAFTTQPAGQSVGTGSPVTFTAAANGSPAPTYQWRKNGSNIAGATGASYTIASAASTDAATYTVVASNSAGSATSNGATLTVTAPDKAPTFTTQPTSRTVTVGASVTFTAAADGKPAPTYQWRKNGTAIGGATGTSYTIAIASITDAATYTVVATNAKGSATSNGAVLTVNQAPAAPAFTVQPTGGTITAGSTKTFSATVTGYPAPNCQWHKNGVAISGANSTSLTIANATTSDAGTYTVVATNSVASATSSSAALTVTPAPAAPVFTAQPSGGTVTTGGSISFTATATGYPAPTYQWRKDGAAIAGATGATYSIANATSAHAGIYTVVATNSEGSATSSNATLAVNAAGTGLVRSDFNGDRKSDIMWQNVDTGETTLWLMNGTTRNGDAVIPGMPLDWKVVGHGDFNKDGKNDFVFENTSRREFGVIFMNGTVATSFAMIGSSATERPVGAADFNGDGQADILAQNRTTGEVIIRVLSGMTETSRVNLGSVAAEWAIVGVGDFNGDGKDDILWENATIKGHGVWLLNGTTFSSWLDLGTSRLGMSIAGTGDFNADGKTDILWWNKTSGLREIALMSGSAVGSVASLGYVDVSWQIRN